jgi:hypothetical protein
VAGPAVASLAAPLSVAVPLTGLATWYRAPTIHDAAAGPALRVGAWRGSRVTVCTASRCIAARLSDWCACPHRLIDLDRRAFAVLAPPSVGVVRVTVTGSGPVPTAPATDGR